MPIPDKSIYGTLRIELVKRLRQQYPDAQWDDLNRMAQQLLERQFNPSSQTVVQTPQSLKNPGVGRQIVEWLMQYMQPIKGSDIPGSYGRLSLPSRNPLNPYPE